MKKIVLLCVILVATFASCSSDDAAPVIEIPTENGTLIKKISYDYSDNSFNETITYNYDGVKLIEGIYDDSTKEKYFYTGDAITKIEYRSATNELEYQDLFSYNNDGKLIEYRFQDFFDDSEEKSLYVYNGDNTITETQINGPINNTITTGFQSKLYLAGDEVVKKEQLFAFGATYNYNYDSKNSPFRNVLGYGAIVLVSFGDHELFGKNQNITSIFDETNNSAYMTNTSVYNAGNFPTAVTSVAIFDVEFPSDSQSVNVVYLYQ